MKKSYLNIILITTVFLSYADYSHSAVSNSNANVVQDNKKSAIPKSSPKVENTDSNSSVSTDQSEPYSSENNKSEEKSPDYFYMIIGSYVLSLIAIAVSTIAIMQNNKIKEALKNKLTKSSLKDLDAGLKNHAKDIGILNTSLTSVNTHFAKIDAKINTLEEKQKALNIKKPLGLNEFSDNANLMNNRLKKPESFNELQISRPALYEEPIKMRTYEDDLIEDFNSISFSEFRDRYETKRIDIKNPEEIISNTNVEPIFIERDQGKYYITPLENSETNFYLFPGKASDIKIDEISRKIFKFSKGYSEGSYSNWKVIQPSIVQFNSDGYTVNQSGKIEIQS